MLRFAGRRKRRQHVSIAHRRAVSYELVLPPTGAASSLCVSNLVGLPLNPKIINKSENKAVWEIVVFTVGLPSHK
jgi:hypothetical protein